MNNRTAVIIATIGVILSLCVGVAGGAAAGLFAVQYAPRFSGRGQLTLPLVPQQGNPNPSFRVPSRNLNTSGALVTDVTADSPAAKAGLQNGDIITAVDGQAVDANHTLDSLIQQKKPGDTVKLTIDRNGQSQTLSVTLGANPNNSAQPMLGIRFTTINQQRSNPGSGG